MQEETANNISASDTFSVGPPAQRFSGRPGETIDGVIAVNNLAHSKQDLHYRVAIIPYSVAKDTYRDDFVNKTEYSAAIDWVTIDESSGTVAPNESKKIHFHVAIPEDAPSGGQYFAITVSNYNNIENASESLVSDILEIASVVYLNIEGEVVREGKITENSIPLISFTTPILTTASFENTGNTHLDAMVTTQAVNVFSGEEVYPEEDGVYKNTIVMPGAKKSIQDHITSLDDIGIYNITQTVSYGGETSVTSHISFVLPYWLAIIILLGFATIIFFIVRKIISSRRKNPYRY